MYQYGGCRVQFALVIRAYAYSVWVGPSDGATASLTEKAELLHHRKRIADSAFDGLSSFES